MTEKILQQSDFPRIGRPINPESAKQRIAGMEVGATLKFPLTALGSIRSTCSNVALLSNKKYSTVIDKDTQELIVTRLK